MSVIFLAVVVFISSLANLLHCNSNDDLFFSIDNPSTFCTISGEINHYDLIILIFNLQSMLKVLYISNNK